MLNDKLPRWWLAAQLDSCVTAAGWAALKLWGPTRLLLLCNAEPSIHARAVGVQYVSLVQFMPLVLWPLPFLGHHHDGACCTLPCCLTSLLQASLEAAVKKREGAAEQRTVELDALAASLAEREAAVLQQEAELEAARE